MILGSGSHTSLYWEVSPGHAGSQDPDGTRLKAMGGREEQREVSSGLMVYLKFRGSHGAVGSS